MCGSCLHLDGASQIPSRCFRCGSRLDVYAAVRIVVAIDGVAIDVTPTIDFVGEWSNDLRAEVQAIVAEQLSSDDATTGPVDGWQL